MVDLPARLGGARAHPPAHGPARPRAAAAAHRPHGPRAWPSAWRWWWPSTSRTAPRGAASRAAPRRSSGRATHQVRGGPAGLSEDVYRRAARRGRRAARARPSWRASSSALDLDRQPLRVLGVDPLAEAPFRGHLGGRPSATPRFAPFFTDPEGRARRRGLRRAPRSRARARPLRVRAGDRVEELRVLGLVGRRDGRRAASALDGLLLMDVGAAQRLLGMEGRLSRIDLILAGPGPRHARRCSACLPPAARARARERAGRDRGPADRRLRAEPDAR